MTHEQTGLRLAAAATIGFGLILALATVPILAAPARFLGDILIWPLDGAERLASTETRLMLAIAGGVMAGWGWLIWQLAGEALAQNPDRTRRLIRQSLLLWFAVDSTTSIAAGVPLNVIGNLVFAALFLLPMRRDRRAEPA